MADQVPNLTLTEAHALPYCPGLMLPTAGAAGVAPYLCLHTFFKSWDKEPDMFLPKRKEGRRFPFPLKS